MQILEQFDGTIEWKATERPPSDWAKRGSIPPATEQSEGASPQRLSEARERPPSNWEKRGSIPPATERSEGASPQWLSEARERHMHWNLIDGTTRGYTR